MKVLVTGAAGILGTRVLAALRVAGHSVVALRRPQAAADPSFVDVDLANTVALTEILHAHRAEVVIHLAWYTATADYKTSTKNLACVAHTLDLLRLAHEAGCRRFIGAGTCAEYDWSHPALIERVTPCAPRTLYGAAKLAAFSVAEHFAATRSFELVWPRYGFLFGGGMAGRLVGSAIAALSSGRNFACSSGHQVRDFQHFDDAAAATLALVDSPVTGPINIGSGQPTTVRSIVESLQVLTGGTGRATFGASDPTEPPVLVPDLTRLRDDVGWRASTPLADQLARAVAEAHRA